MLAHLPHPTLLPTSIASPHDKSTADQKITPPPPTAGRPGKSHHRSTTTSDFASNLTSSRSSSPPRASTFLPFLKLTRDRSISPEPVSPEEAAEFEHTFLSEESQQAKSDGKPGKLANWFSGVSEPVNIKLIPSPVKEKHDPFLDSAEMECGPARNSMSREVDNMTRRPLSRLQKSNSSLTLANKDPVGSKLAFWRSKPSSISDKSKVEEDEFTALDVQTALFPSDNDDESTPDAFKRLQTNAQNTILPLQTAYQKSLQSVREVRSEKNVLTDELEAAQTRSEHLKLQLANMAAIAANQESAMQSMAEELAVLRQRMREDADFRSKSLRIVTNDSSDADETESLGFSHHRKKRHSTDSSASEDSLSNSVFSHPPLGTCTPISATYTSPELYQTPTFLNVTVEPVKECQNCHGVKRSEAWDVIHVLKEEGKALKARLAECESANEDVLGLLEVVSAVR
jgi:hypothetical protein